METPMGLRALPGLLVLMLFGALAASAPEPVTSSVWNDPVDQWASVTFSHKLHLGEIRAQCSDCHAAAASEQSSDLLLPKHPQCAACHDVEDAGECATCHHEGEKRDPFAAPAERTLRFNHKLHVAKLQVECTVCHRGLDTSEHATVTTLPAMSTCNTCHNDELASRACETCHVRPEALLPLSHRQTDWAKEHKRRVRTGNEEADCASCHTDSFCETCHAEPTLQHTSGASPRAVSEFRPGPMGQWPLVLQTVHGLNHRFGHSVDLKNKTADCYTCHDQQKFCVDCHSRDQDAGFEPPIPESHGGSDFVRLGVGSGGGRHADMARREIESCASCHDVEGRDAVCVTCHIDRNPGRGNDPRTHPSGFLNEHGDWHSNPGSVCFNCHTNTHTAGLGFCGYCHGAGE
jgi:hypothetical protein